MKESLHNGMNGKMNSLARSNASIYGTKDDLYDRLKRHAYPGKKGNDDDEIWRVKPGYNATTCFR